jgi:hypothetical protein
MGASITSKSSRNLDFIESISYLILPVVRRFYDESVQVPPNVMQVIARAESYVLRWIGRFLMGAANRPRFIQLKRQKDSAH